MNERELNSNMLSELINDLGYLASVTIQHRYIVNGTKEAYVTPDDLLEDLDSTLLFFRAEGFSERVSNLARQMGSHAFSQLLELEQFINENPAFLEKYTFETIEGLIHGDPVWKELEI